MTSGPCHRIGPQPQALHYSYEKAGLTLHDQPIPWNAEAVLVEAWSAPAGQPPAGARPTSSSACPAASAVPAENLRREESDERHRLFFRLAPPAPDGHCRVALSQSPAGPADLAGPEPGRFVQQLRLQMPTLFVRLGEQSVACQTFVATQCKGLLASAVLTSPTSLVPLLDLDLRWSFARSAAAAVSRVPAQLCSSQLAGRQALVTVVPRRFPRRIGTWLATWMLGDQPLATQRDPRHLASSSSSARCASPTRALSCSAEGRSEPAPAAAAADGSGSGRALLPGQQRGAGHGRPVPAAGPGPGARRRAAAVADGAGSADHRRADDVRPGDAGQRRPAIRSAPSSCAHKGEVLGVLSLCPAPAASFTAEGGFKPPEDFTWSAAAEEELNDRLTKLLEDRSNGT